MKKIFLVLFLFASPAAHAQEDRIQFAGNVRMSVLSGFNEPNIGYNDLQTLVGLRFPGSSPWSLEVLAGLGFSVADNAVESNFQDLNLHFETSLLRSWCCGSTTTIHLNYGFGITASEYGIQDVDRMGMNLAGHGILYIGMFHDWLSLGSKLSIGWVKGHFYDVPYWSTPSDYVDENIKIMNAVSGTITLFVNKVF